MACEPRLGLRVLAADVAREPGLVYDAVDVTRPPPARSPSSWSVISSAKGRERPRSDLSEAPPSERADADEWRERAEADLDIAREEERGVVPEP